MLSGLVRAARHFVDPANLAVNAEILARSQYLDGSAELIGRAISDRLLLVQGGDPVHYPDFMFQYREAANFPWVSQAAWLYAQMVEAGHATAHLADYQRAQAVFRPDIYRSALGPIGATLPGASSKLEGGISAPTGVGSIQGRLILTADSFFDGQSFDPDIYSGLLAE